MIAGKIFKKLDHAEMIEIFDAAKITGDDEKLLGVIDDLPELFFLKSVQAGQMRVNEIAKDSIPMYRVYWQIKAGGKNLHICASLSISDQSNPSVWGSGVEILARAHCCRAVTFTTSRRGHIADAITWGAVVTGVTMKKTLQ